MCSTQNSGLLLHLPGWRFPAIVDFNNAGNLASDNFGGRLGDEKELHRFLQTHAIKVASIEARRLGCTVFEQKPPDGSVLLDILVEERGIAS